MDTVNLSSRSYTSFTGPHSPRYPAPDVARGFMLLLIALANVPFWTALWTEAPEPTAIGTVWESVRGALVDQRSYPLFAMLFGFGLVVMARRRVEHDVDSVLEANRAYHDSLPEEGRAAFVAAVREAATVDARKMVRRRGLWMVLFGVVHSLFFSGDIIGAYGLIAVIFAGTFVRRRKVTMWVVSLLVILISAVLLGWSSRLLLGGPSEALDAATDPTAASPMAFMSSPWYPLIGLYMWLIATPMTVLTSMALPASFLGAWIAGTDLLTHPERRRGTLIVGGLAGLAVATLTWASLDALLDGAQMPVWAIVLVGPATTIVGGLAGACGWLALLAAFAGGARADGEPLTGVRWLLAAVGKRSMTAYLSQTVCFGLLYGGLAMSGAKAPDTALMALSAVVVWGLVAGLCAWLERAGRRGPFERLLRAAVARSARRSRLSELAVPSAGAVAGAPTEPSAAVPDSPAGRAEVSQPRPM
ncbi:MULTISPECIES: DUF418 domain-containing protein [Actinomyces]|uniref:DUF418 domain-containing protein n=1 Tax=Actinomyces respiraculi TaxID=2744574 RepID=A0A7T0LKY3_9ACTO|nr:MULTISPECIES: DUF418 domain-containing protein [Actinomyces]QPL05537.1 DUF418 domain-containing protein [Actinomyces respiraculi]